MVEKSEEYPGWIEIEGRPDMIMVEWTEGYYEYDIHRVLTLGFENIWAFTLRRSG